MNDIPVADLECICNLLGVSCEELLSAGKYFVPDNTRLTNYNVAFSHDKDIWERYINNPDKPILNPDEYGKTVIDYAIDYKNIDFINYLIEKEYIWFDSEDIDGNKNDFRGWGYRTGTSIKGRNIGNVDYYMPVQLSNYKLRNRLIMLAIENGNVNVLERTMARELPYIFNPDFPFCRETEEFKECKVEKIIKSMGEASGEIVEYMTDSFEFDVDRGTFELMYFFISDILNVLVENNHPYTKTALKKVVDYNKKTYEKLRAGIKHMIADTYNLLFLPMEEIRKKELQDKIDRYFPDEECKNEECKIEMFRKTNLKRIAHNIIDDIHYFQDNKFVKVQSLVGTTFEKYIFNIVHVNAESADPEIKKMIDELNHYYEKIISIKDEMEGIDYDKIMF